MDSIVLVVHYSRPFPARFVSVVSVFSTVSFPWFRYFSWFRFGGFDILVGFVPVVSFRCFGVSVFRVLAHAKKK